MEEEVKVCTDGLVWYQIPPKNVGEIKKFWDFNQATEYNAPDLQITNHNVRLFVNKKTYPETDFENTYDGLFVAYQLMDNELDGYIEPTREFFESISRPRLAIVDNNSCYIPFGEDEVQNGGSNKVYIRINISFLVN